MLGLFGAVAAGFAAPVLPSISLRLAEIQPADHPTARADFEFARLVLERSQGRIRIAVYTDSVLGQELAVLEQLRFGGIDIARVSLSAVAPSVPRLAALQMPYLYRDADHMWRVLQGDIGRELLAGVSEDGLVGLGWFEAGARSFYTVRGPVRVPADLKGLRIRVQENSVMTDTVAAFGALPRPRAFGETYSALETGEIDGAENNLPTYYSSGHYRVARWFTRTEHVRVPEIILGSGVAFAALAPEDRELIARAALDAVAFQRKAWADYEALVMERLQAEGVVVREIPDREAWRRLTATVYERQTAAVKTLVARIRALP
jgi:tripartite ATP-independent transporter DctP family solute receptor